MATDAQSEWVRRVLGFSFGASSEGTKSAGAMMPVWMQAKEAVDAGLDKLHTALRRTGDEDLIQIADYGLYGVTQGQSVKLMAALTDADRSGTPEAKQRVVKAAQNFRNYLDGAPVVDMIERNPFGVSVNMRQTLGAALAELQKMAAA